jgi:hypothetical protein
MPQGLGQTDTWYPQVGVSVITRLSRVHMSLFLHVRELAQFGSTCGYSAMCPWGCALGEGHLPHVCCLRWQCLLFSPSEPFCCLLAGVCGPAATSACSPAESHIVGTSYQQFVQAGVCALLLAVFSLTISGVCCVWLCLWWLEVVVAFARNYTVNFVKGL